MEPPLSHDSFDDLWKTLGTIEDIPAEEHPDGMSQETRLAVIRTANLKYCIANHLI